MIFLHFSGCFWMGFLRLQFLIVLQLQDFRHQQVLEKMKRRKKNLLKQKTQEDGDQRVWGMFAQPEKLPERFRIAKEEIDEEPYNA